MYAGLYLSVYRAIVIVCRALFSLYVALLSVYVALLSVCRALFECIHPAILSVNQQEQEQVYYTHNSAVYTLKESPAYAQKSHI